ncbi:MAG: hypothetical protein JXC32_00700 [Anaerolineae bacterium]|nr:hypothetical protein [Anaerolineae bacterium]
MKNQADGTTNSPEAGPRVAQPASYEITVEGVLDPAWEPWLDGLTVHEHRQCHGTPVSILVSEDVDQAALRGALGRLWDLNLALVALRRRV